MDRAARHSVVPPTIEPCLPAFRALVDNAALHVLEVKAEAHLLSCARS
jgi:hypothetical protein